MFIIKPKQIFGATAVALLITNKTPINHNKLKIVNYDVHQTIEVNLRDTTVTN